MNNSFRCSFVESLESLKALFVVLVEYLLLSRTKDLRREATEKLWCTIQELDTERGSRVATVTSSKTHWENRHKSSLVSRYSCQDIWQVSMNGFNHTNVFSFIAERDFLPTKADWGDKFPIEH